MTKLTVLDFSLNCASIMPWHIFQKTLSFSRKTQKIDFIITLYSTCSSLYIGGAAGIHQSGLSVHTYLMHKQWPLLIIMSPIVSSALPLSVHIQMSVTDSRREASLTSWPVMVMTVGVVTPRGPRTSSLAFGAHPVLRSTLPLAPNGQGREFPVNRSCWKWSVHFSRGSSDKASFEKTVVLFLSG